MVRETFRAAKLVQIRHVGIQFGSPMFVATHITTSLRANTTNPTSTPSFPSSHVTSNPTSSSSSASVFFCSIGTLNVAVLTILVGLAIGVAAAFIFLMSCYCNRPAFDLKITRFIESMKVTISDRQSLRQTRLTNNRESSHQGSTRRRSRRSSNTSGSGDKLASQRAILEILRESRQDSDGVLDLALLSQSPQQLSPQAGHSLESPSLATEAALSVKSTTDLPGVDKQTAESGHKSGCIQQNVSDGVVSPAGSDLKSRNYNHFHALIEQESLAKLAEEAIMSPLEREMRVVTEQERLMHERRKLLHYTKLGGTFKVTTDLSRPASPRSVGIGVSGVLIPEKLVGFAERQAEATARSPAESRSASVNFITKASEDQVNSLNMIDSRNIIGSVDSHHLSQSPSQPTSSGADIWTQRASRTLSSTPDDFDHCSASHRSHFQPQVNFIYPHSACKGFPSITVTIPSTENKPSPTPPPTPPPPSPTVTILSGYPIPLAAQSPPFPDHRPR